MNPILKNKILSIGLILAFILSSQSALAAQNSFFAGFRSALLSIIKTIDYWVSGFINYKEIQEENNVLTFQNRALKSLLIEYRDLKEENELLKEALQLKKTKDIDFILANIVGRSPLNFSQTFVIDKGEEDGIKVGQAVIWGGKTLVGEVIEVSKNFSTVRALTDTEFKTAVFVGDNKIEGLFKGNGFLDPYVDLVPLKEQVQEKDQVYTSGLDKKFIRGLYIGEAKSVEKPQDKIFLDIKIQPAIDWTKIYQVLIIK